MLTDSKRSSLSPRSSRWVVAVVLICVRDVSATIATFLPMKAILILASNSVPSFLPEVLVSAGATSASITLLVIAGFFGFLTKSLDYVRERLDRQGLERQMPNRGLIEENRDEARNILAGRKNVATQILSLLYLMIVSALSLLYAGITLGWAAASVGVIALKSRDLSGQTSFASGIDQALYEFSAWLQKSALWASVGIAIATLLVAPPSLGTTGILICAVLGRKLLIGLAETGRGGGGMVSSGLLAEKGAKTQLLKNRPRGARLQKPIDFLVSTPGLRIVKDEIRGLGFGSNDFVILDPAHGPTLTLVLGPGSEIQSLVRLFDSRKESLRNREQARRSSKEFGDLFGGAPSGATTFAGFPAIRVNLEAGDVLADPVATVTKSAAWKLQLAFEARNLLHPPDKEQGFPSQASRGEELQTLFSRALAVPGRHRPVIQRLLKRSGEVVEIMHRVPTTLVPSSLFQPAHCYLSRSGRVLYLGGHSWTLGKFGSAWRPRPILEEVRQEVERESDLENAAEVAALGSFESRLTEVERLLSLHRYSEVRTAGSRLLDALKMLGH